MSKLIVTAFPFTNLPGITTIFGPPNTGKTILALDLIRYFGLGAHTTYLTSSSIIPDHQSSGLASSVFDADLSLSKLEFYLTEWDRGMNPKVFIIDDVNDLLCYTHRDKNQPLTKQTRGLREAVLMSMLRHTNSQTQTRFVLIRHVNKKMDLSLNITRPMVRREEPIDYGDWGLGTTCISKSAIAISSCVKNETIVNAARLEL